MFQGALAFEDQLASRLAEHLIEVYGGGGQGKARCHGAMVPRYQLVPSENLMQLQIVQQDNIAVLHPAR